MTRTYARFAQSKQRGVSLVIVLIFLVILSVLGVSAMQTSTLSSRIAKNELDRNLAFQAAESALRDGELDVRNQRFDRSLCDPATQVGCRSTLLSGRSSFKATCPLGRCVHNDGVSPWESTSVWDNSGVSVQYGTYTGAQALPLVGRQPRYLLEAVRPDGLGTAKPTYRITAVGYGASTSSQVMLQTVVVVSTQL
jgi:type IV pilus assembly protein PilX